MISVLCPSRGRPHMIAEVRNSISATATTPIELIVALDSDDPTRDQYQADTLVVGPRTSLGTHYNRAFKAAKGDIIMITGDDMMFVTPNWDQMVRKKAEWVRDDIYCIFGTDTQGRQNDFCMFLSRKAIETLGYAAPSFLNRHIDTYLSQIYRDLNRHFHVPFVIDHRHHRYGKRDRDETDRELDAKKAADIYMWEATGYMRTADVETLRPLLTKSFKLF